MLPETCSENTPNSHAAPELPAYDTGRNLIVWCDHCRVWHAHGRSNGGSDGDGHRVAHCHKPNSPYDRSGYFIRYIGPATPDILKDLQRRRPKGPADDTQTGYAILELGTGYMDGWYYKPLHEVMEIARWLDEERPQYPHRVIAKVEPFALRHPVVFIADVMRGGRLAGGAS